VPSFRHGAERSWNLCVVIGEATAAQFDRQAKVILGPQADEFEAGPSSTQLYYYFVETD